MPATKRKKSRKKEVLIKESHLKEKTSKRAFADIVAPWACNSFDESDYGIDTLVEIVETVDFETYRPESKFFFVQLKASNKLKYLGNSISFQVEVKKIMQWLRANLPVLLILHDQKTAKLHYLWIDNLLTSKLDKDNPSWVNNTKVSLKLSLTNILNKKSISEIKDYVYDFSLTNKRHIEPGTYFKQKELLLSLLDNSQQISREFNFSSVDKSLRQIGVDLEMAIYKLAISGPSRAGKSSLINYFLRRQISPTRMWQTTGVPIQVLPGKEEIVEVYFSDGKSTIREAFSFKLVEKYASQEYNEDNMEKVKMVCIYISSQQLERGVSFFDLPGLDDPDDNVLEYCWQTIIKSDAIIYLVDAQPAQVGGFIFRNEFNKHLKEFFTKKDKVFLVFNRIDLLDPDKIREFKEVIKNSLTKLNLYEYFKDKIFFIAANPSSEKALSSEEHRDPTMKLEEEIWKFLLKENKIGLVRLVNICKEFDSSLENFKSILSSGLLDNNKRAGLTVAINEVKKKVPVLASSFNSKFGTLRTLAYGTLESKKFQILEKLEESIRANPNQLPSRENLSDYLTEEAYQAIEFTNSLYAVHLSKIKEDIDAWIETNLKSVKGILNKETKLGKIDMEELKKLQVPDIDLSSAWGMGLLGTIAGFFIAPEIAIGIGILSLLGYLVFSDRSLKEHRIIKMMKNTKNVYEEVFNKIKTEYNAELNKHYEELRQYINRKITDFFSDLESQIKKIESLDEGQKNTYNAAMVKTGEYCESIRDIEKGILRLYNSTL